VLRTVRKARRRWIMPWVTCGPERHALGRVRDVSTRCGLGSRRVGADPVMIHRPLVPSAVACSTRQSKPAKEAPRWQRLTAASSTA
jgi:hypothetical protein